ncbi:MAG: spore protease YyaC [Candidatus Pristimantibacillus lignocellulolyticus]|uniref:Spore protease YyaC n=1 Tax=Candidatus Pristimantibacillus lignocellulolyticus TaxID=2994561 RepID=A0A9J6ZLS1_9BACL|nr:MAG: spore protease YyaC [Candidatus Pristimantibacillus lignocellulolyticus]
MQQLMEQLLTEPIAIQQSIYTQVLQDLQPIAKKGLQKDDIVFVCIGTDRSTGDAFGPIMGTVLQQLSFPYVIGTLAEPCDAYKVEQALQQLPSHKLVIAIDACLGNEKSVGTFIIKEGSIQPGAATGRRLPPVGHYSIAAVINENGPKAYWKIQNTSLFTVLGMVATLRQAVIETWALDKER